MIILDNSYVSERMRDYLVESQQPVLDTPMARRIEEWGADIVLVGEEEAAHRVDAGERLYVMSETDLPWVGEHIHEADILQGMEVFKDKERMRNLLKRFTPHLKFRAFDVDELLDLDYPADYAPFVLKPTKGFLSMGVHTVRSEEDWNRALADVRQHRAEWPERYGTGTITGNRFLIESLIEGTEYALDAYYDGEGQVRLLDILRHDFADASDTSDRLYLTSAEIMREKGPVMSKFLQQANGVLASCNFPVHAEVREKDGIVQPIEFNPLRFAGMGGTEISHYAYGFFTFDQYLNDRYPHQSDLQKRDDGFVYCISVLNPPDDTPKNARFDYEALKNSYGQVLAIDPYDYAATGTFGIMFWKTDAADDSERNRLLHDDLSAFIRID